MHLSIVAPLYNHRPYLEACLNSLAMQHGAMIELVLFDDCSPDDSFSLAEELCARSAIRDAFAAITLRRNKANMGAAETINAAIRASRGEVVMVVNTDDLYHPERVAACARAVAAGHRFVFTGITCVDSEGRASLSSEALAFERAATTTLALPAVSLGFIGMNRAISTGNFCFTRELYELAGPFRPLLYCHDWDFALRACLRTEPHFIAQPYYLYRLHGNNSFRSLAGVAERESRLCLRGFFDSIVARDINNAVLDAFAQERVLFDALVEQGGAVVMSEWQDALLGKAARRLPQPPQPVMKPRRPASDPALEKAAPEISVLVPNRDYGRFMAARLSSIFAQTVNLAEIVILDDASTDDSVAIAASTAASDGRKIRLLLNEEPSGNVFRQWRAGIEEITSEFLWIAEADDLSDPAFLETVVSRLRADSEAVLGFCDSVAINVDGRVTAPDGKVYSRALGDLGLEADECFPAREFLRRFLSPRNLIVNVSAVVWRTAHLRRVFARLGEQAFSFTCAGDWRVYVEACRAGGTVHYVAKPLNHHRRHSDSVTQRLDKARHFAEVKRMHEVLLEEFPEDVGLRQQLTDHQADLRRAWALSVEEGALLQQETPG